jgi:multiple sugar transport system permease protein
LNAIFGWNLTGFFAGPSLALMSIIVFGIWTYVGYNVIIYLAGLGQIPNDLYEAARVDGASEWHLFRYITLPMVSPITFYLSILGFIGTFKTFNHVYVMRSEQARGTADTISVVVFDTFRLMQQYGEAAAQAIILLVIIIAITQFQRTFLEKQVFYG